MKKTLLSIYTFISVFSSLIADDADASKIYLNAFGGLNFRENTSNYLSSSGSDLGITSGLAIGVRLSQIRLEGEFSYRYNPQGSHYNQSAYTVISNLYYEFDCASVWEPYMGAGLGAVWIKSAQQNKGFLDSYSNKRGTLFAYQGIAGISRTAWEGMGLAFEYRAFMVNNHLRDSSLVLSIRQYF